MSGGFEVDLGALVQAAEGVNGTMRDLQDNEVSDIGGPEADYGDDDLAATVSTYLQPSVDRAVHIDDQ
jgi:hypothetical protein